MGDPHPQLSNLEDLGKVVDLAASMGKEKGIDTLIVLGDMFHTHAVVRLEVIHFWRKKLSEASSAFSRILLLVGNHDMIGDKQREGAVSALDVLKDIPNVKVIDSAQSLDGVGFVPYMSDDKAFLETCNGLGTETIVCHQTFDGSQFENGFYAPEGIDQNLLKAKLVVSGHIHKTQKIGKVFYPGTPKWDTMSDANEEKGVWYFDGESFGVVKSSTVIEPLRSIEVRPDTDLESLQLGKRTIVELVGPSTWVASTAKKIKGGARVVARPTDKEDKKRLKSNTVKNTDIFTHLSDMSGISNKQSVKSYIERLLA